MSWRLRGLRNNISKICPEYEGNMNMSWGLRMLQNNMAVPYKHLRMFFGGDSGDSEGTQRGLRMDLSVFGRIGARPILVAPPAPPCRPPALLSQQSVTTCCPNTSNINNNNKQSIN